MRASFIDFEVVFGAPRATQTTAEMDDFKRRLETRRAWRERRGSGRLWWTAELTVLMVYSREELPAGLTRSRMNESAFMRMLRWLTPTFYSFSPLTDPFAWSINLHVLLNLNAVKLDSSISCMCEYEPSLRRWKNRGMRRPANHKMKPRVACAACWNCHPLEYERFYLTLFSLYD